MDKKIFGGIAVLFAVGLILLVSANAANAGNTQTAPATAIVQECPCGCSSDCGGACGIDECSCKATVCADSCIKACKGSCGTPTCGCAG